MPYKDINKRREASRLSTTKWRKGMGIPEQIKPAIKIWRRENPEKYKEQKRRWYIKHAEEQRANARERSFLIRKMVLTHYSNGKLECECCGETIYEYLTLNHIHGGGVQERKNINPSLSRTLIKRNYPLGYNVLCYNCNCADAFAKGCPHKKVNKN